MIQGLEISLFSELLILQAANRTTICLMEPEACETSTHTVQSPYQGTVDIVLGGNSTNNNLCLILLLERYVRYGYHPERL